MKDILSAEAERGAIFNESREEREQRIRRRVGTLCDPVSIDTFQVYDSCRERVCAENLRFFCSESVQEVIDSAINVKIRSAEIIWVYIDVERC